MSGGVLALSGAAVAEVRGETVVLHLPAARYLAVTGRGADLLRRLRAGTTQEALEAALVEGHGLPADRARDEVARWLESLAAHGLLRTG